MQKRCQIYCDGICYVYLYNLKVQRKHGQVSLHLKIIVLLEEDEFCVFWHLLKNFVTWIGKHRQLKVVHHSTLISMIFIFMDCRNTTFQMCYNRGSINQNEEISKYSFITDLLNFVSCIVEKEQCDCICRVTTFSVHILFVLVCL